MIFSDKRYLRLEKAIYESEIGLARDKDYTYLLKKRKMEEEEKKKMDNDNNGPSSETTARRVEVPAVPRKEELWTIFSYLHLLSNLIHDITNHGQQLATCLNCDATGEWRFWMTTP